MGLGIAEIDEQTVTEKLGDMPIIPSNHLPTGGLVGTDYFPILFGIELAGELRRVHQIAEHHGELATFGFWGARCYWRCGRGVCFLDGRLWSCLGRWREYCVCAFSITDPDQNALILLHCQSLRVDKLVLQVCQCLVVESELAFQKAIGHPFPLSEQLDNLVEDVVQAHYRLPS